MSEPYPLRPDTGRSRRSRRRQARLGGGLARRWPRRILIGANVVVALSLVAAGSAFGYFNWRLDQINKVSIPSLRGGGGSTGSPFTMLVVGSDSRAIAGGAAYGGTTGPNGTQGQRSDTIMLVRVVPATRTLSLLSVPRDLYVPVKGLGMQKINAAFDSGPDLLISTIESQVGVPIDHFVEVNFDSFQQITDAIGGVGVYFPTPVRDGEQSTFSIPTAGCTNLTGNQALSFVRSRFYEAYYGGEWHTDGSADLGRIQRQQFFVKKMIDKARSQFTNPLALNGIIGGVTKNLVVDSGMSTTALLDLARTFRSVDVAAIQTQTLPTVPAVVGGQDVLDLSEPKAAAVIQAFNTLGSPTSPAAAATTATVPAPATPVVPSSVRIEVANGSGVAGQATRTATALAALGYRTTVAALPGAAGTTTRVLYAPDSLDAAEQLAHQVEGGVTLVEEASMTSSPYNLELITGTTFTGVGGTSAGAPAPTTVAPTTAAPAVAPPPTYVLPPHPLLSSVPAC